MKYQQLTQKLERFSHQQTAFTLTVMLIVYISNSQSQILGLFIVKVLSIILFEHALLLAIHERNCGSSGTVFKNLSRQCLKTSFKHPVRFRISLGKALNNFAFAPFTARLPLMMLYSKGPFLTTHTVSDMYFSLNANIIVCTELCYMFLEDTPCVNNYNYE